MTDTFPASDPSPYEPVPPEPPSTTWSNGRIAALLIGFVALVGGTFLAVSAATGGSGGPEGAVEDLFEAIANEDVIGVLGAIDPEERDAIEPGIRDLVGELKRLGVFSETLDLEAVAGVDFEFDDLEMETQALTEDLVAVRIVGGTATTATDPAQAPLGRLFDDTGIRDQEAATETDELEPGDEFTLVAVRRDGWHVSLGWSILEAARGDEGFAFPDPANGLEPQGGGSPTEAVDTFIRSAAALDVERTIALLAPGELDPLHAAAPLFLADAQQTIEALKTEGVSIEITSLELADTEVEGGSRVSVEQFGVTVTAPELGTIGYEFDGECTRITGLEDSPLLAGAPFPFGFPFGDEYCAGEVPDEANPFAGILPETIDAGIIVVERDGEWFVSPTRTIFDALNQTLAALPDDGIEQLIGAFTGMFGFGGQEEFSSIGEEVSGEGSYSYSQEMVVVGEASGGG